MITRFGRTATCSFVTGFSAFVLAVTLSLPGFSREDPAIETDSHASPGLVTPHTSGQTPHFSPAESVGPSETKRPDSEIPRSLDSGAASANVVGKHDETFIHFIEAVSGKPVAEEIRELVRGIVSVRKNGDSIEIARSNSPTVIIGGDTELGAQLIKHLTEAKEKLTTKFGPEVGQLLDEFVGVTASASHIEVIRTGPDEEEIDLSERKIKKKLPLKRIRLAKIALDVAQDGDQQTLKNIAGIQVVPNVGLELTIELKEFSRAKNAEGDDVLTFGVKNPVPMLKPFRRLFGFKEIIPFTWTAKKKVPEEIGSKESSQEDQSIK